MSSMFCCISCRKLVKNKAKIFRYPSTDRHLKNINEGIDRILKTQYGKNMSDMTPGINRNN